MEDIEINISIQTTEPLAGTATADGREPLRFEGWLELLRAVSTLIGARSTPDPCAGSSTTDPHGD
ncbi:MAG: hypothetical protein QN178_15440 [Armatimonadota bacterium]|nr:hypothetical protein [Armatimonadota bacterium]